MSKNVYQLSFNLGDNSIKKVQQNKYKNPSFKSYHHKTDLGVWTYSDSDDELIFTPFINEVVR
jgi:hypothetical protein